ncbi:DUF1310 family protein [Streptococcus chenjunshii]|uniref:DUF1310 family protein n=1 Tax=Streptococcus chenjunshii TaxID=2173853 RepID=A0A372KJN4_9STRE|nr:DUF1310 family protein [Streptococcus chenjunshii]AXQ79284.1 DUF1310 family protein [Streptococcus chenjunshii]RFU49981.1 DUF1310 family protein [Streptococcus chenjunshii]RFU52144.1 DUF1310 family protein [Streptococcus chenjunshii]
MPRKKKVKRLLFSIAALIGIGIGGFAVHQHQEKQKMIEIATSEEARKVYVDFIKKREAQAFTENGIIQSFEIDRDSLEYNPMGGLMVRVVLNGKRNIYISFNLIENDDGSYHSAYFIGSPDLLDFLEREK